MQGPVELAVAAAVEAVADRLSGGGGDRGDAGEPGERGLASDPAFVGPGEHDLGCEERPDAGLVEELWCELLGQGLDLAGELALLDDQLLDAASDRAEREQRATQLRVLPAFAAGSPRGARGAVPGSAAAARPATARVS